VLPEGSYPSIDGRDADREKRFLFPGSTVFDVVDSLPYESPWQWFDIQKWLDNVPSLSCDMHLVLRVTFQRLKVLFRRIHRTTLSRCLDGTG
jgi:hypothetical protein